MQVKFLDIVELEKFYSFNKQIFAERLNYKSVIDFWLSKNPKELNLSIILKGENEEIFGQNLHSSMFYFYNKEKINGEWGFDFIVREDIRKDGYGIDLLQFALKHKKNIFAVGSGPLALKIEMKLGFKFIGELRKYVGIGNMLFIPTSFFRGVIQQKKYPAKVKSKTKIFKQKTVDQLPDYSSPFNSELLEIGRDKAFLGWRYFSDLHQYAFYKEENGDDYFVVRTIVKKGITCLVLVDYRCDFSNQLNFVILFKAIKKVASKLKLSVIITGSSIRITDEIFEKMRFMSIGRPRPIITTEKFTEERQRIENRDFVFVTLADSDGEITW